MSAARVENPSREAAGGFAAPAVLPHYGQGILSHSAVYLAARGLPGLIAFAAIPLFSRLLDPQGYGRYALVLATVGLLNALLFQWLRLALVRFLPGAGQHAGRLKSTLATLNGGIVVALGAAAGAACLLPLSRGWRGAIALCWVTLAAQAAFELCCEYARGSLRPWHYMRLQLARAVAFVGLGAAFLIAGAGWWGPLAGLTAGMTLAVAMAWRRDWRDARPAVDRRALGAVARYGVPLSLTVALTVVISTSDRYVIAWLLGERAAGLYAAAADFTSQSLTLLMVAIHMASFPLAVRAWEREGAAAARATMRANASLLLAVGVPSVIGLSVLSRGVAGVFLGEQFRAAAGVVPVVALGGLLAGLKAYHFDAAFQFAHRTTSQVWIVALAAAANLALLPAAVSNWGLVGAAAASVLAYGLALALTALIGRRYVALPFPPGDGAKVVFAAAFMGALLFPFRDHVAPAAVAVQVVGGAAVYVAALLAFDFMGLRTHAAETFRREPVAAPLAAPAPEAA